MSSAWRAVKPRSTLVFRRYKQTILRLILGVKVMNLFNKSAEEHLL